MTKEQLIAEIKRLIKQNGNKEITGDLLQVVLVYMVEFTDQSETIDEYLAEALRQLGVKEAEIEVLIEQANALMKSAINALYNVSQINNKYDYANNQTARLAVPTADRKRLQILCYQTVESEVVEIFIGNNVSQWNIESNFKNIGSDGIKEIQKALNYFLDENANIIYTNEQIYKDVDSYTTDNLGGELVVNNELMFNNGSFNPNAGINAMTWKNIPLNLTDGKRINKAVIYFTRWGGTNHCNALAVRQNGQKVALVSGIVQSDPISVLEKQVLFLDEYDYLFLSFSIDGQYRDGIRVVLYSEDKVIEQTPTVKEYIDNAVLPLQGFSSIKKFSNERLYKIVDVNNPDNLGASVNHVKSVLLSNNALSSALSMTTTPIIYQDIPTKIDANNYITSIKLDFIRWGGDPASAIQNSNVLGIRKGGKIDIIVAALSNTPTGQQESITFNTSEYEYISLTSTNDQTFKITTYQSTFDGYVTETVKEYIDNFSGGGGGSVSVQTESLININTPNTIGFVNIIGDLPTDASDTRTPTDGEFEFGVGNTVLFKCKTSTNIQGNATATLPKKGYRVALSNYMGSELKVQFGEWLACNEFDLKSYPLDPTMSRDVTTGKLWYQFRRSRDFPQSYIADFNAGLQIDNSRENMLEQALFFTDGFPIELRVKGVFYGLYVLRLKKERDNYMINRDNTNHVFLDNEEAINWNVYTPSNWKIRSPRLQDEALDEKLNRWWVWFAGIHNKTIDFNSTADQYINKGSWVDALITQQLSGHWDYQINNMLLFSWDGKRLSICYYDGDQTWSSNYGIANVDGNGLIWRGDFFRNTIYPNLKNEIMERYTWLRNNGYIDMNNIYKTFRLTTDRIPREIYEKEFSIWKPTRPDQGVNNLRYILDWGQKRIIQLDKVWLNK